MNSMIVIFSILSFVVCISMTASGPCNQRRGVVGPCRGRISRFTYNRYTGKCEQFFYGGCHGNDNRFRTRVQCIRTCENTSPGKCEQTPGVVGHCRGSFPQYTYYPKTGKCKLFYYGGCGGNENRFPTLTACQKMCART